MSSPKKNKTEKRLKTLAVKTKEQKRVFLEQLPKFPIVQVACEKTGVGRSTYYAWRNSDRKFAKEADTAIKSGEHFINDMAESKLIQNIQNGNNTAIIYWLKNHHPSYNERIMHSHRLVDEGLDREERITMAKALINIGLGNIIKMNKQEYDEAVEQNRKTHEAVKQAWENVGTKQDEEESKDEHANADIDANSDTSQTSTGLNSSPKKRKDRMVDINEFLRKRKRTDLP